MSSHTASCRCGQLKATATGAPVRVSVCHCLNCKKRSGSAFAAQVRLPAGRVEISGQSKTFDKAGDSGAIATFHFCPNCGSDVYYLAKAQGDLVAIPLGAFDDPFAFTPGFSVWEERKPDWVEILGPNVEHSN